MLALEGPIPSLEGMQDVAQFGHLELRDRFVGRELSLKEGKFQK